MMTMGMNKAELAHALIEQKLFIRTDLSNCFKIIVLNDNDYNIFYDYDTKDDEQRYKGFDTQGNVVYIHIRDNNITRIVQTGEPLFDYIDFNRKRNDE